MILEATIQIILRLGDMVMFESFWFQHLEDFIRKQYSMVFFTYDTVFTSKKRGSNSVTNVNLIAQLVVLYYKILHKHQLDIF